MSKIGHHFASLAFAWKLNDEAMQPLALEISEDVDDATLVERTLAGNADAYTTLMRRHFDEAFSVARRLTVSDQDAEDACQEALARAYFRLRSCEEPEKFRGWLMQIVRHHAHNVRRYQSLRSTSSLEAATHIESAENSESLAETRELGERLRSALSKLSPVKQKVIHHHDVEGWNHFQISRALGISVLMSRRHLSDARKALRSMLGIVAVDFLMEEPGNE